MKLTNDAAAHTRLSPLTRRASRPRRSRSAASWSDTWTTPAAAIARRCVGGRSCQRFRGAAMTGQSGASPAADVRRPGTWPRWGAPALPCSWPVALAKRKLIHWLLAHDFEELPRRATSHRRFRGPRTTITVPAHGRPELSAKHTGMLVRELEKAGFDRDQIRKELGT